MKKPCTYLVIDDDSTSNLICEFMIRRFDEDSTIISVTKPEEGLEIIRNRDQDIPPGFVVLFLDINMPSMTGFEFLSEFQKFPGSVKQRYIIYMLTSSIEDYSPQAAEFPEVKGFFSKPMRVSYLEQIQSLIKKS